MAGRRYTNRASTIVTIVASFICEFGLLMVRDSWCEGLSVMADSAIKRYNDMSRISLCIRTDRARCVFIIMTGFAQLYIVLDNGVVKTISAVSLECIDGMAYNTIVNGCACAVTVGVGYDRMLGRLPLCGIAIMTAPAIACYEGTVVDKGRQKT